MCLHKMFKQGFVKAITREKTPKGVQFYIFRDKIGKYKYGRVAGQWQLTGAKSLLRSRDQVLLAIELAKKYNVQRVEL